VRDRFVDIPPKPGDTGAYNRFWFDSGTAVVGPTHVASSSNPPTAACPDAHAGNGRKRVPQAEDRRDGSLRTWDRCTRVSMRAAILPSAYNNNLHIFQT